MKSEAVNHSNLNAGHILDKASLGKLHHLISLISSQGLFLGGFNFFIISLAIPLLTKQWHLSSLMISLLSAAALLGAIFGGGFLGHMTDRFGRRLLLSISVSLIIVFSLCSALAWNITSLILFRFLIGIGIGADYTVTASYLAETMPKKVRGQKICFAMMMNCIGIFFGILVSYLCLFFFQDLSAWRLMLGISVIPGILVLILRRKLPESPRWLIANNQSAEAQNIIFKMTAKKVEIKKQVEKKPLYRDLFSKKYRRQTFLTSFSWFLCDISYYGIGIFIPLILASMHFASSGNFLQENLAIGKGTMFISLFIALGAIMSLFLVERIGRLKIQKMGFLGAALSLLFLSTSSFFVDMHYFYLTLIFTGVICFNFFINAGPGATTFLIPAEVYPTNLRASGHGFAVACGKIGAVVGIFLFPMMIISVGTPLSVFIIALTTFLGYVVTQIFGVETRGLSIDEISVDEPIINNIKTETVF